jgi:hypothetical protein
MSRPGQKGNLGPHRRRYVIHLSCANNDVSLTGHYIARIRLWSVRSGAHEKTQEHAFMDEYELIETINPLLPHGSDVRDVLSHVESPDGFLYLLYLSSEEAGSLGWRE